jgi:hypothetical protein
MGDLEAGSWPFGGDRRAAMPEKTRRAGVRAVLVLKERTRRHRSPKKSRELVAQMVEQRPFKAWVLGSSPSELTTLPEASLQIRFRMFHDPLSQVRCF